MKKIKTSFRKKDDKDDHWRFGFEDEDSSALLASITRNQPVELEIEPADWNVPIQAVKLSNFRALAVKPVNGKLRHKEVQVWEDLYVALVGSGKTYLTLEVDDANNEFLKDGDREADHRLIEFSAEIFMADGKIIEVDPIIDERPT